MHTSVRKYTVDEGQMDELIRRVEESFAPRIEAMPGFVAYQLLDCGHGILMTITTCHDRAGGRLRRHGAGGNRDRAGGGHDRRRRREPRDRAHARLTREAG
jgi:hypothetical protein